MEVTHRSASPSKNIFFLDLNGMPEEIQINILSYLKPFDLACGINLISKHWNQLSKDNSLWSIILKSTYPDSYNEYQKIISQRHVNPNYFDAYVRVTAFLTKIITKNTLEEERSSEDESVSESESSSEDEETPKYKSTQRLIQTQLDGLNRYEWISSSFVFYDRLAIGGLVAEGSTCTWNLATKEMLPKVDRNHTNSINAILIHKDMLITASQDCDINIANVETGKLIDTLIGHMRPIKYMQIVGDILISGSADGCICLWNLDKLQIIKQINDLQFSANNEILDCFDHEDSLLVTGVTRGDEDNSKYIVSIWDLNTNKVLHELDLHSEKITRIKIFGKYIISASCDDTLQVWDRSGNHVISLNEHTAPVIHLKIIESMGKVISGSNDGTLRIWNIEDGSSTLLDAHHRSRISSFDIQNDKLVSIGDDQRINISCLATGRLLKTIVDQSLREGGMHFVKFYDNQIIVSNGNSLSIIS